jgi:hypothetical protein
MRILAALFFVSAMAAIQLSNSSQAGEQAKVPSASQAGQPGDKKDPPKDDEPKKDPNEPKDITIKDKITKDDPFDTKQDKCHCKVHVVKMIAGYQYVVDMKADPHKDKDMPSFDTFLRLEDAAGKLLAENDDYITTDSRIVFTPDKAGDFRIICTTFDPGFTGSYTLTVTASKGGIKGADPKVLLNLNAALTKNDPFDDKRTNSHHKVHVFKMQKGKQYQIDMISSQFDAYLRLETKDGVQLAEDDDSGGMLNARIYFTPMKTGSYRIIATTFGPGVTGMYTLKVSMK